jgi:tetratricopeptide (TPR) repeat protein
MHHRRWFALVFTLLLSVCAQAQFGGSSMGAAPVSSGNVHVHVVFDNDRSAGPNLQVRLMMGSSSMPVELTYTDDAGEAEFRGVPVGEYNVEVIGDGIVTTRSPTFDVDERKVTQSQYVVVHHVEDSGPKPLDARGPVVSVADLNVAPRARRELDRANHAMLDNDYKGSLKHLQKALVLAPRYATAFNNLGVLYARMNDPAHEREALEQAISIDDHFGPALLNLGKLCVRQRNFPQAEGLLERAAGIDPTNTEALMLLADAKYMDKRYDSAIADARLAHARAAHSSFVHYIAARAYLHLNKPLLALAEFQTFLKEEPTGPRANQVRGDIARLGAATASR